MLRKNLIPLALMAVLAVLASPVAFAQTPDGETPANEGVCDELLGGTPGLYGLCVAFCEALDLAALSEPITEANLEALEDSRPSGRILANYNKKKTESDPEMPCVKVEEPCPCWDSVEFEHALIPREAIHYCTQWSRPGVIEGAEIFEADFSPVFELQRVLAVAQFGGDGLCAYECFGPTCPSGNTQRLLPLTFLEVKACEAQIRNAQAELFPEGCTVTD